MLNVKLKFDDKIDIKFVDDEIGCVYNFYIEDEFLVLDSYDAVKSYFDETVDLDTGIDFIDDLCWLISDSGDIVSSEFDVTDSYIEIGSKRIDLKTFKITDIISI